MSRHVAEVSVSCATCSSPVLVYMPAMTLRAAWEMYCSSISLRRCKDVKHYNWSCHRIGRASSEDMKSVQASVQRGRHAAD